MSVDLDALTLSEAAEALRRGDLSSEELTSAALERIEKTNGELNSLITVAREDALAAARASDERRRSGGDLSKLDGIPLSLKDIFLTRGMRTTCASRILEGFVPPYEGRAVASLRDAGAVFVGKANMDEFAMGSSNETSAFGPVRNPWDLDRVPGGSSGGSAASVAARQCLGSLGTDTGGSIRQPASLCGVVGVKPTYGRVSRYGVIAFASSLDQVGPLAPSVRDAAILLSAIAGFDPRDATSVNVEVPDYEASLDGGLNGLRIGIPEEYFGEGTEPDVEKSVREAIRGLEASGAKTVPISLPHTRYGIAAYYLVATAEASSNLARYDGMRYGLRADGVESLADTYAQTREEGFGTEVKRRILLGTFALSAGYAEAYYGRAQRVRTLIRRDFESAFEACDVVVGPTSPSTAFALGERMTDPLTMYQSDVLTLPANLAGLPGVSVPCGLDARQLPIGFQVIAPAFEEGAALRVAHAVETAAGGPLRRKP